MAKSKPDRRASKIRGKDILRTTNAPLVKSPVKSKSRPEKSIPDLISESATLLEQSQPELAFPLAREAFRRLTGPDLHWPLTGPNERVAATPQLVSAALLLAEIHLALGDADDARRQFLQVTRLDPDGTVAGPDAYLWLAQLSETGGQESIRCFDAATQILRREITTCADTAREKTEDVEAVLTARRGKLAEALCGMAEVYMTDLSWEADAETRCEGYVTEAVAVCPEELSAGVLQTLASVRISQERMEEARTALRRSMGVWNTPASEETDAQPNDKLPDFATRISLSRLLMEVEMEDDALNVLEGLVREDDQSVEAWYLGGWCQVLQSEKRPDDPDGTLKLKGGARHWLSTCLRLYQMFEYEDERLKGHAHELIQKLNDELGMADDEHDDDWEDEADSAGDAGEAEGETVETIEDTSDDVDMT